MFEGERCFEGTRALTTRGIDKPVLNLFRILSRLGDRGLELKSSGSKNPVTYSDDHGIDEDPDIGGLATYSQNGDLQILLYCHHDDWDVEGQHDVELQVTNLPFEGSEIPSSPQSVSVC
jgi:xylan 1,4-beta-xylosidase